MVLVSFADSKMVSYDHIKLELDAELYPKYVCRRYLSLRKMKTLFSQTFESDVELDAFCWEVQRLGLQNRVRRDLADSMNGFARFEYYEKSAEVKRVLADVNRDFATVS